MLRAPTVRDSPRSPSICPAPSSERVTEGEGDPSEFYFDVTAAEAATSGVEAVPIDCDCLYELEVTTIEDGVERMDAA